MQIKPLKLAGTFAIHSDRATDERGYFMRTYDRACFAEYGLKTVWQQESLSFNLAPDTIRGLHFQTPLFAETKVVRVLQGAILDVFVDLRKDSVTYGSWDAADLSSENGEAVYIPAGFAHGFRTLEPNTLVEYKIDVAYAPENSGGILWNDKTLDIDWQTENSIVSQRDDQLPPFDAFVSPF